MREREREVIWIQPLLLIFTPLLKVFKMDTKFFEFKSNEEIDYQYSIEAIFFNFVKKLQ